jgi:hypothetical protein
MIKSEMIPMICELLDVSGEQKPDLILFNDKQSCIKKTKTPVNHGRAKHNDIKYHHICDDARMFLNTLLKL